jgi:hypothetical protein
MNWPKKKVAAPGQYWIDAIPPKVRPPRTPDILLTGKKQLRCFQALSDIVESVIGAIFISDNFSPDGAQSFFDKILKPFYDKHITLRTLSHHPTKTLFEVLQAHGCQQFEVTREYEVDGGIFKWIVMQWYAAFLCLTKTALIIYSSGHSRRYSGIRGGTISGICV